MLFRSGGKDRWMVVIEGVRHQQGKEGQILCNRGRILRVLKAFGKLSLVKMYHLRY